MAAVLLFAGIHSAPVYILDEAKNAQAAREMWTRGEWIIPTFNGELRSHKPPLHYYFMRIGYSLFGVNPFGARFFSAVSGLMTMFITWLFARRFISEQAALLTTLVLLLSTHFMFEFHLAVPDPYLIFFITAGILCFYAFIKENRILWLVASAASAGLATLAKGPVALALPGLSLLVWMLITGKRKQILSWRMLLYLIIIVAVALPWYLAVHLATNGVFTKDFFLLHNIERFDVPMEGHGGIFLLIPLFVLIGFLPFSVFTGEMISTRKWIKQNDLLTMSICVISVVIIFFSVSGTKLPNYPMPCYPFIALWIGSWLAEVVKSNNRLKKYPHIILIFLNLLLAAAAWIALDAEPAIRPVKNWAIVFILLPLTAIIGWLRWKNAGWRIYLKTIAGGYFLFNLVLLAFAYPSVYRQNPVSKTIHLLNGEPQVYSYKTYNPAYNFYLDKSVKVLNTKEEVRDIFISKPNARIICRESELIGLEGLPIKILAKERDLFETPTTVIFTSGYEQPRAWEFNRLNQFSL